MFAEDSGSMDDCNAALILLKLSASPHSPQRKYSESTCPGIPITPLIILHSSAMEIRLESWQQQCVVELGIVIAAAE